MESTKTYGTTIVALKCKRASQIPFAMVRDADMVVIKGYRIAKDATGAMEGTISAERLDEIKDDSAEVITVNEFGRPTR